MNNLLRFDDNQLYFLFDTETQCLNLLHDNLPWQLGFIVFNNKEIIDKQQLYIWHENFTISPDAARVTRFDRKEYERLAKPQKEVFDLFESYLYDDKYVVCGHNIAGFDVFIHLQWRRLNGLREDWRFLPRMLDTKSVATAIKLGVKSLKRENWPIDMFKYGGYVERGLKTNLALLGKEYGIKDVNYDELHSGLNDCDLNKKVWDKMKWMIDI
jgi:hypothetical protein